MGLGLLHNVGIVLRNKRWNRIILVERTTRSVGSNGRVVTSSSEVICEGIIQPASGNDLDRLMEGDRGNATVSVWTSQLLTIGDDDHLPDKIHYNGQLWLVKLVDDWLDYGKGFCKAICVCQDMQSVSED